MEPNQESDQRIFRAKVDASGRILLPAELRAQLHVTEGDSVLFVQHPNSLEVRTLTQAVRKAQEYFGSLAPASVSMVDELLAERRAEVARE
jgi:AbrB family transcriptional regulator (stage V sporulation protein T)